MVWSLLLLALMSCCSVLKAAEDIKCHCNDPRYCINSGEEQEQEEECPDRLPVEYIQRNKKAIQAELEESLYHLKLLRSSKKNETEELQDLRNQAALIVKNMSADKLQAMVEAALKMAGFGFVIADKLQGPDAIAEANEEINAFITGNPIETKEKPFAQYCVKFIDGESGNVIRSCGVSAFAVTGPDPPNGCHIQTRPTRVDYCRCNSTLCNTGDISIMSPVRNAGLRSSNSRSWMQFLVLSLIKWSIFLRVYF